MNEKLYGFDIKNQNAFRCYISFDVAEKLAENFSDCIEKLVTTSKESNDKSKKFPCMSAGILLRGFSDSTSESLVLGLPLTLSVSKTQKYKKYGHIVKEAFPLFDPSNRENSIKAYEHYAYLSREAVDILRNRPDGLRIEWDFNKQILKEVVSFFESVYKENFFINLNNERLTEYKQRTPEVLQSFLSKVYNSYTNNIIFDLRIMVDPAEHMPHILFIVRNEREKYWYGPLDVNLEMRDDLSFWERFKIPTHRNYRVLRCIQPEN